MAVSIDEAMQIFEPDFGHLFALRILSKLLFSAGVSSFAASITASRSSLSQILMLSIVTARGIVPLSTNSKNFVLPIPRYAAASSARKPRGLIKWFGFCNRISVSIKIKASAKCGASPLVCDVAI
jgi:hypothetical protein